MHWGKWVSKVAQSCPTLCDHMDGSLPVSCVHGILQARVLEWVAISFSGGSSRLRDRTRSPALQADALPSEPPESYLRQERIELSTDQSWPYCLLTWQVIAVKTASKSLCVCCSVAQLSDPSWTHGLQHDSFPVLHHLMEFAETHVHWVSDAIQPSHPLSSPSLPALNLSQHQGLFQWVSSSH